MDNQKAVSLHSSRYAPHGSKNKKTVSANLLSLTACMLLLTYIPLSGIPPKKGHSATLGDRLRRQKVLAAAAHKLCHVQSHSSNILFCITPDHFDDWHETSI